MATGHIGVDIGGTFVDAVTFDSETGTLTVEKAPTTPDRPTEGALDAIDALDVDLSRADSFVHGTPPGANAVLEREAREDYGVVLTSDDRVDREATESLRDRRRD